MKGEFDEYGKLSIYRNGILKRQYCPRPGKDYHVCQCSDNCPGILENGDRHIIVNCFGHSIKIIKDERKSENIQSKYSNLELTDSLHICQWFERENDTPYKISIAYWMFEKEGPALKFIYDRPLEKGINWNKFEDLVRRGQKIADEKWKQDKENE